MGDAVQSVSLIEIDTPCAKHTTTVYLAKQCHGTPATIPMIYNTISMRPSESRKPFWRRGTVGNRRTSGQTAMKLASNDSNMSGSIDCPRDEGELVECGIELGNNIMRTNGGPR